MQSKSFCEDLTEGKFSFPIIHAIHFDPNDTQLLSILRQKTSDYDVKRHAIKYMHQCGSVTYTREVLRTLLSNVIEEIDRLGGHQRLKAIISHLDSQLDAEEDIVHTEKIVSPVLEGKISTL